MAFAMDFGTCNTVFARWNTAARRPDLISIPGLSRQFAYRLPGATRDSVANVVPTLIHYGEGDHRLLGQQVDTEGLVNHPGTFRWAKLDLLKGNDRARRINGNLRRPREAATQFVSDALNFALGSLGGAEEDLVITVPVEAFDHYVDWLRATVEPLAGGRRVRLLDEATACILGYQETVRNDDVYLIADFGGGTLDVSIVRVSLGAGGLQKCLRHSTALHMLQKGVRLEVIALWLGHEKLDTAHHYLEADLTMKEKALQSLHLPKTKNLRYQPPDELLDFLGRL